jgi:hypothetical protein
MMKNLKLLINCTTMTVTVASLDGLDDLLAEIVTIGFGHEFLRSLCSPRDYF